MNSLIREIQMKFVLLLLSVLLLASCQKQPTPQPLSDVTEIVSSDSSRVQVQTVIIYIKEGLTITEFNTIVLALDNSKQTFVFTTNDGGTKTRNEIFEFDTVIVFSESGYHNRTYSFRYLD